MPAQIRLACLYCDRNDHDGIDRLPNDWIDIGKVQSYEEACRPVKFEDQTRSVLDWYTHLGVCPDCQAIYG